MKLWGGRFKKGTDKLVNDFNSSIRIDSRMYKEDIQGSLAHASMLGKQNIIPQEASDRITSGLLEILKRIENGVINVDETSEDIHSFIESTLTYYIGDYGKMLHTGRSRNDQVTLDFRLYLKNAITDLKEDIIALEEVLLEKANENIDTIMPGYTHLQKAQPITFAHHILAYAEMFKRDYGRLTDCYKRLDEMPLGAGALATSTYPIDRDAVARDLGFSKVTLNSLDSVSDRDYAIETLSCLSMIMMHLSRFSEEIILWCTNEFSFIELDDGYSTGSSIMPQKKNPDVAELVRGKTGRVYGDLMTLLTVMKGIPLAYNKDMQEDKEAVFDGLDTASLSLKTFCGMIKTMKVKKENMRKGAGLGFTNATDVADYLVKKGMAFRNAHGVVGEIVLECINKNKMIEELTLDELKEFSPIFEEDIYHAIDLITCVEERKVMGGPSTESVKYQINALETFINKHTIEQN
ncbi:argininosuccinate lyase [Clostridium butyricum]|jgi:argininosuccinate lyase|uniref:Argininosuccinate lyase n=1 Tax=Clostridium butyricum TaxID=1492 RepID=A0A512TMH2_CLOBU|nr:argininosuccinate lyase [Clostridium butyricum]MBS5983119.1 argininosuccinate lyase [Clostridium butyricum]MDB2153994.1 argininosuccinate lyase [Clostridium butyricum]MDU1005351.1 argininosuccinate lyase [Clostridium butyricum]MDU5721525.1 argininosuccinate lyase [Clostridium butyricum]MDU5819686.1 argininosuccinate lyase [Clostridium butyricum]